MTDPSNTSSHQALTLEIEGMHCASCTGRVERVLRALPGVETASANLAARTARVAFAEPATPEAIAAAVEKAGYQVAQKDTVLDIEGMHCASCVGRVERKLKAAPGVTDAAVNLATHSARVTYLSGDPAAFARIVTEAGYPARPRAERTDDTGETREAAEERALRRAVILSAALTLPVFVLAMGGHLIPAFHHWIAGTIGERMSWIIQFVLTTAVLAFPGRMFLRLGLPMLMRGAPDMNSLVALGALAAWSYSSVATFAPALLPVDARAVYFEAAAVIVTLILVGRLLESRARGQAGAAIRRLIGLRPDRARVRRPEGDTDVALADLAVGDLILLRPGERAAVDGIVTEGESLIDESMLTGEPLPVAKSAGAAITGGTVNGHGSLVYRATHVGGDTVLARIIRMVEDAQGAKLPVQAMVDRITLWFVPAVMTLAGIAFLAWLVFGPDPALTRALIAGISVLIIACPCAMGLATPTSIMVGTGRGADLGLLFRRGDALQRLGEVGLVAFDKTGTLTEGRPELTDLVVREGADEAGLLARIAAAEARSEHPLAPAILRAAEKRGLSLPAVETVTPLPGRGLRARVEGRDMLIGTARLLEEEGIANPFGDDARALAGAGKTPVFVAEDGGAAALMALADPVKPGAAETVAALHELGLKTALISGDTPATAGAVARRLGIDTVIAGVLPDGKVAALADLSKTAGTSIAFVGDGINDAPALAAADVGIAIGTGTDVAIETADLVLMRGDPRSVSDAIHLSRATMRNIRQNLGWAFGYNVALIPVAAGALYPLTGQMLSPMLAAGAMAASSVLVVTNALRLRRAGPWRAEAPVTPAPAEPARAAPRAA